MSTSESMFSDSHLLTVIGFLPINPHIIMSLDITSLAPFCHLVSFAPVTSPIIFHFLCWFPPKTSSPAHGCCLPVSVPPCLSSSPRSPDGSKHVEFPRRGFAVLARHHLFPASPWPVTGSCLAFLCLLSFWPSFLLYGSIILGNKCARSEPVCNCQLLSVASSPDPSHPLLPLPLICCPKSISKLPRAEPLPFSCL